MWREATNKIDAIKEHPKIRFYIVNRRNISKKYHFCRYARNMIESGTKNHDESRFNDNKKQKWKMRMLGKSGSDRAWAGHECDDP